MDKNYIGVIEDPRSEDKKSQDFQYYGLVASSIPIEWREKDIVKSYLIKNQDGSLSCVSQATAKILGIHEVFEGRVYKNLSPKFIYTRRSNYPSGGMWFQNALDIAVKSGSCLEESLPSDFKNEAFMNDKDQEYPDCAKEALEYKAKNYVELPIDIDKIAEVMEQGYGVLLGFRFDYNEWTTYPFLDLKSKLGCHHGVAGIDYTLIKGVKHITIDDSWGPGYGKGGVRYISEEFLKARCTYAGFVVSLVYEPEDEEFHCVWSRSMRFYGKKNIEKDVMALQKGLQTRGYFPKLGKIDGVFGAITLKAVKDFQRSYGLTADGIVGPKTLLVLNTQFK